MVIASDIPIGSEAHLPQSPGVVPLVIGMETRSAAEALPVDAVIEVAISSSIAEFADALIDVSAADGSERPVRVFRTLRDDVDDAGNRVRSPDRAARSSNDFDTFDILKQ